jgi:hypothetical protein
MSTIFVQIASYRDPLLISTIDDCLAKARYPENLTFGIAWQHDETENLEKFNNDSRFKILDINYSESKGVCWARHKTNTLYSNEDYTLQIDSHTRFIENWDEKIISMWKELDNHKAILTSYPPEFYPEKEKSEWGKSPHIIHVHSFNNKQTEQRPFTPPDWKNRKKPYKAIHVAAGFIFGKGSLINDVPYDPNFYFSGEETGLTVRFYTHGYDIYHPHEIILWHYYTRKENKKHWDDCSEWGNLANKAIDRLNCLLKRNDNYDLGIYGLGNVRSLEDFQNYSGIDYKRNILHLDTTSAKEPPVDFENRERWSYTIEKFKHTIKWDWNEIDHSENLRFIAFIFKDQNDDELYRKDITLNDSIDILNGNKTELYLEFEYYSPAQIPSSIIIWPYSQNMKWLNQIRKPIK